MSFSSFSTALSGLNGNSTAVDAVGNNLANINTVGYKDTTVSFRDMVAATLGQGDSSTTPGIGVDRPTISRHFTQGNLNSSSGSFDAAIKGNGFFIVKNSDDQTLYTRAGNFKVDKSGYLKTQTGEYVQGTPTAGGTSFSNITIPTGSTWPATATDKVTVSANLNSAAAVDTKFSVPLQVYDSLGATHNITVTYTRAADTPDTATDPPTVTSHWTVQATILTSDTAAAPPDAAADAVTDLLATPPDLAFDATGKLLSADPGIRLTVDLKSGGHLDIGMPVYDGTTPLLTQTALASSIQTNTANGNAAGTLTGVSIEDGGKVVAKFSNGQETTLSYLGLASFANPESLADIGNNNFSVTADTATAITGTAGTSGLGEVKGKSLEGSTVDIATEFTRLIVYQRGYQANSRVITTTDQMSQEAINLKQ